MNSLQIVMNEIKPTHSTNTIPTENFVVKIKKQQANRRQISKILDYAKELECLSKDNMSDDEIMAYTERFDQILLELRKMKIRNPKLLID